MYTNNCCKNYCSPCNPNLTISGTQISGSNPFPPCHQRHRAFSQPGMWEMALHGKRCPSPANSGLFKYPGSHGHSNCQIFRSDLFLFLSMYQSVSMYRVSTRSRQGQGIPTGALGFRQPLCMLPTPPSPPLTHCPGPANDPPGHALYPLPHTASTQPTCLPIQRTEDEKNC
ncbi:hypothetical protein IE53DRAFT_37771 [Violaceomyces palustris]|uniref:Uncharacterized protein n=1 Tax=Violaceomyces palustris TaxID=1673888 RepID=A0ACD0P147_9BASI|nr:hypothetical protein IE53DRAFT_37771 [Violaceomyces palustris]